jgi:predicted  nucleic acid-binding Zn-ribbon protein|tara:strand:- start:171 stop:464 length:294 start_codon:yes stop_codon:yes gene_type:complete
VEVILPYIIKLKNEIDLLLNKYKVEKNKVLSLNTEKKIMMERIVNLENEIKELKERVDVVDLVKGINDKDDESASFARTRVNNLIRQIDKCISLLNE